jgi:predicted DNA-binding protein
MEVLQLLESLMGRETEYIERTIDTHIDEFEDLGFI